MPLDTLRAVKRAVLPQGPYPRTIPFGLLPGVRMNVDLGHNTQMYLGLAELELVPWFRRLSDGARTAVDVGAADGYYTLWWLLRTPIERVVALEAYAPEAERLRANLRLNGIENSPRLALIEKAAGPPKGDGWCTLDSVAAELPGPIVLKLDIEGGEKETLEHATRLVARPDTRWIVETHSDKLDEWCRTLFVEHGYRVQVVPRAAFRKVLPELRGDGNALVRGVSRLDGGGAPVVSDETPAADREYRTCRPSRRAAAMVARACGTGHRHTRARS